ncbi:hypothetical protein [Dysgonomonas sp. ZJ279]|uniref:hypothetical protein n=1 Tax=Dysgonomonas sp. ZJ279 TaxID=2709796 RepID=UPI0013EB6B69|nr:hypothetical protein [Dysgonomonas sp. ZJ279]
MKILFRAFIICVCVTFLACGKEEEENPIPDWPVNLKINLISPRDHNLVTPLNTVSYTESTSILKGESIGFSGLLVICSTTSITGSIYGLYAYDLCCPNEVQKNVIVKAQSDGTAKCAKCESVYYILDGSGRKISGPSKHGLKRYQTRYSQLEPSIFYITR